MANLGDLANMIPTDTGIDPAAFESFARANAEKHRSFQSTNKLAEIAAASQASEIMHNLVHYIKEFDKELKPDEEVGMRLVTFGQSITFHVDDIGYFNPCLITFYGSLENGKPVQLIQHLSQLSFVLVALPKPDPDKPKRPFGFAANVP